jgi:hypothetical protein
MKNKILFIKKSWTFNHKMLIIALGLATAHVWPLIPLPDFSGEDIIYTAIAATSTKPTIESEIETRAIELYETNKALDLEKYRQDAIGEVFEELKIMLYESPFIDYDAMKDKHGY